MRGGVSIALHFGHQPMPSPGAPGHREKSRTFPDPASQQIRRGGRDAVFSRKVAEHGGQHTLLDGGDPAAP